MIFDIQKVYFHLILLLIIIPSIIFSYAKIYFLKIILPYNELSNGNYLCLINFFIY